MSSLKLILVFFYLLMFVCVYVCMFVCTCMSAHMPLCMCACCPQSTIHYIFSVNIFRYDRYYRDVWMILTDR